MITLGQLEDLAEDEQPEVGLLYVAKHERLSTILASTYNSDSSYKTSTIPALSVVLLIDEVFDSDRFKSQYRSETFLYKNQKHIIRGLNIKKDFASCFWKVGGQIK